MELPKTEAELDALITSKVEEATNNLVSKHNGEMASLRKKHEAEIQKVKEQANMSAEEIAQKRVQEQNEADQRELQELRGFKKSTIISQRLAKDGLPDYLKNDVRLINSSEEDFEKNYKNVKADYDATQPKGNTHSSVVRQTGGASKPAIGSDAAKDEAYKAMGEALSEIIGK